MQDHQAKVKYNRSIGPNYFVLGLEAGISGFTPGQFAMLQVPPGEGVILRRPFSLARQLGEVTEILYKVVGKGTYSLSQVAEGESLNILAPLGHGFKIPSKAKEIAGVAGGYGVAPFLELASLLKKEGRALRLFYGARSQEDLNYLAELKELGVSLHLATQDGSVGHRGLVTEVLEKFYADSLPDWVGSCGPMGLLKAVGNWANKKGVPAQLSVEEQMACGTGVCLTCVVKDKEGNYLRACQEGPVFAAKSLDLASSC